MPLIRLIWLVRGKTSPYAHAQISLFFIDKSVLSIKNKNTKKNSFNRVFPFRMSWIVTIFAIDLRNKRINLKTNNELWIKQNSRGSLILT